MGSHVDVVKKVELVDEPPITQDQQVEAARKNEDKGESIVSAAIISTTPAVLTATTSEQAASIEPITAEECDEPVLLAVAGSPPAQDTPNDEEVGDPLSTESFADVPFGEATAVSAENVTAPVHDLVGTDAVSSLAVLEGTPDAEDLDDEMMAMQSAAAQMINEQLVNNDGVVAELITAEAAEQPSQRRGSSQPRPGSRWLQWQRCRFANTRIVGTKRKNTLRLDKLALTKKNKKKQRTEDPAVPAASVDPGQDLTV